MELGASLSRAIDHVRDAGERLAGHTRPGAGSQHGTADWRRDDEWTGCQANGDVPGRFPSEPMRYVRGRLTALRRLRLRSVRSHGGRRVPARSAGPAGTGTEPVGLEGGARYAAFAGTADGPRYEDPYRTRPDAILGSAQDCSFCTWRLINSSACSASLRASGLNLMAAPLFGTITRSNHTTRKGFTET